MFIIKLLSQHVSGIILPIIRRTRPYTTAYGVVVLLAVVVCSWVVSCVHCALCEGYCSTVISCVHCVKVTHCTQLTTQLHTTTASTPSAEHHMR